MKQETLIVKVDPANPEKETIAKATDILKNGGIVAFPTETVYGLGADALNPKAIEKVFLAKGRPADNPMIVHISRLSQLAIVAEDITSKARDLIENFWPGPLTIIFKKTSKVPDIVTGGLNTVAVRMPADKVALELIKSFGGPIAAPSANISGRPSGTTGAHISQDFGGKIDMILDSGPVAVGVESTVLDITTIPPAILRPGAVTADQLESVIGKVIRSKNKQILKRSPGTRYRHYSPKAGIILVEEKNIDRIDQLIKEYLQKDKKVGLVTHHSRFHKYAENIIIKLMSQDLKEYARQMFAVIRELDNEGVDEIIVEEVEEKGIGIAIMDRLRRAASAQ